MAGLTYRKRGTKWEFRFDTAKVGGKRKQISKGGFTTKKEAEIEGIKALAEYNRSGLVFEPSELSVSDYLDYWLERYVKTNLSYNSYCDYESKVRIHLKPYLGIYKLSSLQPATIQEWIDKIKHRGYSKSMVKNILACLQGALNYAVMPMNYIQSNPCLYVKIGKIPTNQKAKAHTEYICTKTDFKRIIDRFPETSNFYLPLMLGYNLGTRIGESYGFNLLEDINFEKHEITINHQLSKENNSWYYRQPKYESFRTLQMGSTIEGVLKREIRKRKENMLKYGQYYNKTYITDDNRIVQYQACDNVPYKEIWPISVKENGDMLTTESFKYCARVIHNELDNSLFHSHCLRHTHGTILAENGAFPKTVMERLGHKDIKVTLETYVFNTDNMKKNAVDIFELAINQ